MTAIILEKQSSRENPIILTDVTVRYRSYTEKSSTLKESCLRLLRGRRSAEYGSFNALAGATLSVSKGSVLALIGGNGSGKSTLLKVIAQVLKPSSGSVVINGSVASLIELGVAFDPELNAIENIYLHGALHKKSAAHIEKRIDAILDFSELRPFAHRPIRYYSSGMIARLGFSCAVDVEPDILLVDEILGVGDERFLSKCSKIFAGLIERKKTLVIVSHDLEMVKRFATQAVLLSAGKVVYNGDPASAIEKYRDNSYQTSLETQI
jgi:ABC-type polysaccharide/polyol phosphate transport system ATPase subunit